jgi:hypothetical protein
VFARGNPYQLSFMFVVKARSLRDAPEKWSTGVTIRIGWKGLPGINTSLLRTFINFGRKMFIILGQNVSKKLNHFWEKSSQNSGRAQNAIISTTNLNLKVLKLTNKVKMYKNGFCKKVAQNVIIFGLLHCSKNNSEFSKVTQLAMNCPIESH